MASYVSGLVIRKNNLEDYVFDDFRVGQIMPVPCPEGNLSQFVEDIWAVPVVDNGLFSGFKMQPGQANGTCQPSAQSFQCVRVSDNTSSDNYYVRGNSTQFFASCEVCCGNAPIPLPTNLPYFAPCQVYSLVGAGITGVGCSPVFALPTLAAGFGYFPTVYLDEVLLTVAPATAGYTSVTSLLAYLNSVASSVGVWAVSSDNITITVTPPAGTTVHTVCFSAIGVNASGGSPF
jgi:hypothetical protein